MGGSTAAVSSAFVPIRVLWLIKGLGPGGAEHLLLNQALTVDSDEFDVEVAFINHQKRDLVPQLIAAGMPTTCLGDGVSLLWPIRLWRMLGREGFDVVHVHSPLLASVARVVSRLHRRRPALITTEHNSWGAYGFITRWLNAATFLLDDAHIAVSESARASIPTRYRSQVQVIHHGVAADALPRFHRRS